MTSLPHDVADVMLAPVALHVDEQIQELSTLAPAALRFEVGLRSDLADRTEGQRRTAVLSAISRRLEMHGWELEWTDRGVRLHHGASPNTLVLGVPESIREYIRTDPVSMGSERVGL